MYGGSRITCCVLSVVMTSLLHAASPHQPVMRIVSVQNEPYLMVDGRGGYSGYIKDLLDAAMSTMGMSYELYIAPDGKFGNLQPGGVWNGMVNELLQRQADVAAGPLYITFPRATVIDFTRPFINISTTFLIKRSTSHQYRPINSLQNFIKHTHIQYGTMKVGTIVRAFKTTNNSIFREMWSNMNAFPQHVFTDSNSKGIERVRTSQGRYAFILPSDIADYVIGQEPCNLDKFGTFLNDRHLALAVPKNSEFLSRLNSALIHLEKTGFLHSLYRKWWFHNRQCSNDSYSQSYLKSSNCYACFSLHVYLTGACMFVSRIVVLQLSL